ncbi:MAG TPA: redoxin family protein [Candidatus Aquilonibacter sp.]|nr:redoxin family protein [Candidatus Aquilonibacter sp.]
MSPMNCSSRWKVLAHRHSGGLFALAIACALFFAGAIVLVPAQAHAQNAQQDATQGAPPAARGRGVGGARGLYAHLEHPVLPIGSPMPDFTLPGIDGKMHSSDEYKSAKILAIVFESNHCPVSIAYESRIRGIYEDYKDRGLELVAINPNNPSTVALNELGYTDMTDDMADMKIRAKLRHIDWPYLYDGDTQTTTIKFGAVATPHIFIFDQDRKLRYEGRIDNSTDIHKVTENDARNAIDALLAGQPVTVASTQTFGCSTKWLSSHSAGVEKEREKLDAEPVSLTPVSADDLKAMRANNTGKTVVVEFWSLKCPDCLAAFNGYETTWWMYRLRKFDMITVSTDNPKDSAAVLDYLKQQHAGGKNLQFDSTDTKALQAAVGEKWKLGTPFAMVIGPDGNIVYQKTGTADILEVRRHVLATIPNDGPWFGVQEYWTDVIKAEGQ